MNFINELQKKSEEGLRVCVGLDTDPALIPDFFWKDHSAPVRVMEYNKLIIDSTYNSVACYKPNSAFYESLAALHIGGERMLNDAVKYARSKGVLCINDAKRGDIGNTNDHYVKSILTEGDGFANAITIQPYLGMIANEPFLKEKDKGIIVLCVTSNDGWDEFQNLVVVSPEGDMIPLYQYVARRVGKHWNKNGNCMLVTGATNPKQIAVVRKEAGENLWLLVPGVGAQGAKESDVVPVARNSEGHGFIINASRSVIYPKGECTTIEQLGTAMRNEVIAMNGRINAALAV